MSIFTKKTNAAPPPMLYEQIYTFASGYVRIYYMDKEPTTKTYRELAAFATLQADLRDELAARSAAPTPGDAEYLSWNVGAKA